MKAAGARALGVRLLCIASLLAASQCPTLAQTVQERAACRPDAFRFCSFGALTSAALGNRDGIVDCFRKNRFHLSKKCSDVLAAHGL